MQKIVALLTALLILLVKASSGRDYYDILGVSRNSDKDEIRRAYKRLSIKWHPDKNQGDDEAQQRFIEVSNAYEVLSDEKKKEIYDRYGEDGLKQDQMGGGGGFHDPFEFFTQFTGGGFGRRAEPRERRGPTIKMVLKVDLKDLFLGKVIEVSIDKQKLCPVCDGSGAKSASDVTKCPTCGGRGVRVIKQMLAPGMYQQMQTTCDVCGGKGKVVKSKCPHCSGHKVVRGEDIIDVSIERGMPDGETVVFEEAGDQSADYSPGDIQFVISTVRHPVFTRRGDNLYMHETITLLESLTGFERTISHLDGSKVVLKRSSITPAGYVQEVAKQGMPFYHDPKKRGKLFVEYSIVFPVTRQFSDAEVSQLKSLLSSSSSSQASSKSATEPSSEVHQDL